MKRKVCGGQLALSDSRLVIGPLLSDRILHTVTEPYHDPDEPLLPDEDSNLAEAIARDIGEEWLHEKNIRFGGKSPFDLIGTSDEYKVRDLLRTVTIAGIS